jgi:hypothetical protein
VEYNLLRPTSAPLFFRYPLLSRTNPRVAIIVRRCTPTPCGAAPAETMTSRQASRRHIIFGHRRRNRNDCEHRKYTESPQTVDTEGIAQNNRLYCAPNCSIIGHRRNRNHRSPPPYRNRGHTVHMQNRNGTQYELSSRIIRTVITHNTNCNRACTTKHAVFPTSPLKTLLKQ